MKSKQADAGDPLKIVSWNLLYQAGASVDELAVIIKDEEPDLFVMQEVTRKIDLLPRLVGGYFWRHPWPGKQYGMAVWSNRAIDVYDTLHLPKSRLPGIFPRRFAQIARTKNITITNVHLSHGQVLNRRQLSHIADDTQGAMAIMGDFNAIGPTIMRTFTDVGPRKPTHMVQKLVPFRLDRCLIRNLECTEARILHNYSSDHHPIVVTLNHPTVDTHQNLKNETC